MNPQVKPSMTSNAFANWRQRMGWTMAQAAHVLMSSKTAVAAWEGGTTPIDGHTDHLCESAELLKTLSEGNFFGNALGVIKNHHAKLERRMHEAAAMPAPGRQPKSPKAEFVITRYKNMAGYYIRATLPNGRVVAVEDLSVPDDVPAFKTEAGAQKWIDEEFESWLAKLMAATRK